jgi:hypothetical protein
MLKVPYPRGRPARPSSPACFPYPLLLVRAFQFASTWLCTRSNLVLVGGLEHWVGFFSIFLHRQSSIPAQVLFTYLPPVSDYSAYALILPICPLTAFVSPRLWCLSSSFLTAGKASKEDDVSIQATAIHSSVRDTGPRVRVHSKLSFLTSRIWRSKGSSKTLPTLKVVDSCSWAIQHISFDSEVIDLVFFLGRILSTSDFIMMILDNKSILPFRIRGTHSRPSLHVA